MVDVDCFACDKKIEGTGKIDMLIHLDGKLFVVFFHLGHYDVMATFRLIRMLERGDIDWKQFKRECQWILLP